MSTFMLYKSIISVVFSKRYAFHYVLGVMAEERGAKLFATDERYVKGLDRINVRARKNSINDLCECYGRHVGSNRVPESGGIIHECAV